MHILQYGWTQFYYQFQTQKKRYYVIAANTAGIVWHTVSAGHTTLTKF